MRELANGAEGYDTEWLETQVDLSKLPRMYKRLSETEQEAVDIAVKFSVFSECAYGALLTACGSHGSRSMVEHSSRSIAAALSGVQNIPEMAFNLMMNSTDLPSPPRRQAK